MQAAVLLAVVSGSGCSESASGVADIDGAEVYSMACAQCHYDGVGDSFNPSLITSALVKGPPDALVRVLLEGQQGKSLIDGKPANGVMPSQAYLSDAELAAVSNYIRRDLAQLPSSSIRPEDVARVRAEVESP